jgi:hypothetical protein
MATTNDGYVDQRSQRDFTCKRYIYTIVIIDEAAYDKMQDQPIAKYFSFNEAIGGRQLKQNMRTILGWI